MFGTYVKPAGVTIAETHGIKETPFVPGPDASIRGLSGDYRTTQVGLALRWFKQLAMRGCAVSSMRTGRPRGRTFPGAPSPKTLFVDDNEPITETKNSRRKSIATDLLVFLLSSKETTVFSSDIAEATGINSRRRLEHSRTTKVSGPRASNMAGSSPQDAVGVNNTGSSGHINACSRYIETNTTLFCVSKVKPESDGPLVPRAMKATPRRSAKPAARLGFH